MHSPASPILPLVVLIRDLRLPLAPKLASLRDQLSLNDEVLWQVSDPLDASLTREAHRARLRALDLPLYSGEDVRYWLRETLGHTSTTPRERALLKGIIALTDEDAPTAPTFDKYLALFGSNILYR